MNSWSVLILSLPTRSTAARMRIWRALSVHGAAVLRDGVYLLPSRPATRQAFESLAQEVGKAGGEAHVLELNAVNAKQAARFRGLFDRSDDYARLMDKARAVRERLTPRTRKTAAKALRPLQRSYETLRVADQFPGPAAEQVREFLDETRAMIEAMGSAGEPMARPGSIARLDARDYRGRTWATRARPWVDRLASAWLIRRFIDSRARLLWLKDVKRCPKNALGFDFDGATFTHVGARVTFENLLASFGLESDPALVRLGGVVHCLDVGGVPVAEAAGIESILRGMREQFVDDNKLLAEASRIFDNLYLSYRKE